MLRLLVYLALVLAARAQQFTTEKDVEYGRPGGKPLLLDIVRPTAEAGHLRPGLIVVHGGGWITGDKRDMRPIAETGAREGYVCFNINYRLAFGVENNWPIPLDDTQRAVRWVRAHAAQYHVDPARLGAIGASAGGHLVTFLGTIGTRDNSDPALAPYSSRVSCVVDMFGPTDLQDDFHKVAAGLAVDGMVRQFLGGTPAEKPEAARAASPLWRVNAKSSPFLILQGRRDPLVPPDHSERLHAALQKAGVSSRLVMFDQAGHGFTKKEDQARFALETRTFFQEHLKP